MHPKKDRLTMRDERGQAMAEFAMVVPVLAMILFAILQFGIAFNNYLALTDAVRVGARAAAVSRHTSDPVAATKKRVEEAGANLDVSQLATTVNSSWEQGSEVRVTATYPYAIDVLGIIVKSGQLSSTVVERVE